MSIPDATLTIRDGGLGIAPDLGINTLAILGVSSSGTANSVATYTDAQTLKTALGSGPLVEAACHVLSIAGGSVVCVKTTTSTAGSNGSVTNSGTGTSVMTLTGTPLDSYIGKVLVVTAAAAVTSGVGTFKYSLDGGRTYSQEISLPTATTYVITGTGLTLNFAAGTLVAGDVYSWTSTGPAYTTSDMNTAIDAFFTDGTPAFGLWVVGVPADHTAGAAIFSALDSKLTTAESAYRYMWGLMSAEDDTDANLLSGYVALTSTRVTLCGGYMYVTSAVSGAQLKKPATYSVAARAAKVIPSEDLGRVATGPAKGVAALIRNENATQALDYARFATMRTITGLPGFYVTNGRIKSTPLSDYQYVQHRRVMDIASATVRAAQLVYLNDAVRVKKSDGTINEVDARAIEQNIETKLRQAVTQPGYATDCAVKVDRTVNVLSTQSLSVKYSVTPLGYLKAIAGEISYLNPALVPT